jgi:hypothetical protein
LLVILCRTPELRQSGDSLLTFISGKRIVWRTFRNYSA